MGVIYIGDRATGKTSLALELANPNKKYVKVTYPDYETLKAMLYDENLNEVKPTDADEAKVVYDRNLEIEVTLPTGPKQIMLDWIDTPGEIWHEYWQENNSYLWKEFLENLRKSEGILLVVPPYREIIKPGVNSDDFITRQQWCNRFNRWVQFFRQDCPRVRHLMLCMNKADLFCEVEKEAAQLAYIPHGSPMNWQQRDSYVFQRYFRPIHPQIEELNRSISGLSVRCFITTIRNRELLELPWIYLGSFLAK